MTKFTTSRAAVSSSRSAKPNQLHLSLGPSSLQLILLALIVVASLSYLYYTNQTATGGFDIKGYEQQVQALEKANKQLEVQTAEQQSLAKIEEAGQQLQMVATTAIEYLPAVGASVAVR